MEFLWALVSAAFAAGGAYAAVRVELRALRRDVVRLDDELARAHGRIDQLHGRAIG